MSALIGSLAAELAFATPLERSRIGVPRASSGLQPFDQFVRIRRRLTGQCAPCQDPLDGLGHVQPGSTQWCVQRHDAVFEEPDYVSLSELNGAVS